MANTHVLVDILVVLLAAKVAGELAERARLPAVVGEIIAGILIGPSALALIKGDDVLRTFGELGVLLLLFQVGMETELGDLIAVGRASLLVAVTGVVVPMVGGYAAASALGYDSTAALFVGAALTATSVGITARVFGDMRALNTKEARTVLGAAVADDVIGLVILTVVVGIATKGRIEAGSVARVSAIALGFLVVATVIGMKLVPGVFNLLGRISRSAGTLVALPLAFTLGVAKLAEAAELAPIVGAFVAGLVLQRSHVAERVRRELTPIGHLFIPVFFLQIGVDAEIGQFTKGKALADASLLLGVAIVGKLASALVLRRHEGDRWLIGIGMIPRGEVGLIFATIGLQEAIFGEEIYAALLLVVLLTTTLAPPLLKVRFALMKRKQRAADLSAASGREAWLHVVGHGRDSFVELSAAPPPHLTLPIALEAARLGAQHRPGPELLDWLAELPDDKLTWNDAARRQLYALLDEGGPRSWRFLSVSGVLERAIPELAAAVSRRQADLSNLDPAGAVSWPRLARLTAEPTGLTKEQAEQVALAAVILDAYEGEADPRTTRQILQRLHVDAATEHEIAALVADAALLPSAARRAHFLGDDGALQLALHIERIHHLRGLRVLARALEDYEPWELTTIDQLAARVQEHLTTEFDTDGFSAIVEAHRNAALAASSDEFVRDRIACAPREYVLSASVEELLRHAALCEPLLTRQEVRVLVLPAGDSWLIEFCLRDRIGLMARETMLLAEAGMEVESADSVTWGDGTAIASFRVSAATRPDPDHLRTAMHRQLNRPLTSRPIDDLTVEFDDHASPWHTLCRVEAPDRIGLLHDITSAFATCRASIRAARISTEGERVIDTFELTDALGNKLEPSVKAAIERTMRTGLTARGSRWGKRPSDVRLP